ncbi:MAG: hypothetical protein R3F46_07695 [bacterium]
MRAITIMFCLCCWLYLGQGAAQAQAGTVAALPAGREVVDMRWLDRETLVVVYREAGEAGVLLAQAGQGITELSVPRSLERCGGDPEQFRLTLAPLGNSLALVERGESVLSASRLSVFRISHDGVEAASTYRLPMEFWPDEVCWDEAGANLFMSARPFLQPKQPLSLAMFRLADSAFVPLLERTELDLIDGLAFLPRSGELAVLCRSHAGSYPALPLVVLINPDGNRSRVLLGDAAGAELQLLDSGDLLLRTRNGKLEDWQLPASGSEIRKLDAGAELGWGCQLSRNAAWLALPTEAGLLLQPGTGGEALEAELQARLFRFNHDGSLLAALAAGTNQLQIIELPVQAE